VKQAGKYIAAKLVGAQQVLGAGRRQVYDDVLLVRIEWRDQRREDRAQYEHDHNCDTKPRREIQALEECP